MLPSQLVNDEEGKVLRVRMIQKEGKKLFDPVYLFDEGSTVSWIPCGRKLTCSFPGTCCEAELCCVPAVSVLPSSRSACAGGAHW